MLGIPSNRVWDRNYIHDYAAYRMVRLGNKDYGFKLTRDLYSPLLIARYKCSHPEAQRRFKVDLITAKLMK